jgi:ABC-type branched-subunit amino acid transport system ATPase component
LTLAAPRPHSKSAALDVYYGHSHALQGVDLTLESGVFSVVGRNGMGKSTTVQDHHGSAQG